MIHLGAGEFLMREGDPATCGYLIERGSLEVLLQRTEGNRVLAVLGVGEIVGEMALVDRAPRSASVRAREECLLLPITPEAIDKRFAAADPVLRLVLGTILDRFRATLDGVGESCTPPRANRANLAVKAAATAELRLEKDLEVALREGEIGVHYQPIVRLASGRLAGFEALARWNHPTRGPISPAAFIPIAEASGLSADLARLCLRHVLHDLADLRARAAANSAHVDLPRVAVNISGHDLTLPDFIDGLDAVATACGSATDEITLELTETALVHSPSDAADALEKARRLGFNIAVDDFGTGYSSLNYIRTLPVDTLKIDQSFVQGMTDCATTRSIVASMLQLAESLELTIVGEGIETAAQHAELQMLGCEFGQGYLFGRPLPLEATLTMMSAWRSTEVAAAPLICAPSS